jgi:hypothetical protein
MNVKLPLLGLTLVTLIGCNLTEENEVLNEPNKSVTVLADKANTEAKEVREVAEVAEVKSKLPQKLPTQNRQTTKRINGQKFKLINGTFEKGAAVFNFAMQEFGVIKGSFVIVVTNKQVVTQQDLGKIDNIARDTYRIWPNSEEGFSVYYQNLTSNKDITRVEVEIDYSPKSTYEMY